MRLPTGGYQPRPSGRPEGLYPPRCGSALRPPESVAGPLRAAQEDPSSSEWHLRATAVLGRILGALEAAGVGKSPPPEGDCFLLRFDVAISWAREIRALLEGE